MIDKKRILVTIVGQTSITHIVRTGLLKHLKFFCEPVVCILWDQEDLISELKNEGFEVHRIPAFKVNNDFLRLRAKINTWYYNNVLQTSSTRIQEKYLSNFYSFKKKIKKKIVWLKDVFPPIFFPNLINKFIAQEKQLINEQKCYSIYKQWLISLDLQGLYTLTPFLYEIELIGRVCKELNIPIVSFISSFDNITKRGWPAIFFDHYIVWNKYNKAELERIGVKQSIIICGPPQFDFHFNTNFANSKKEWVESMNIPLTKKIILYSGSSASLFPNEPQYLKHLKEAIQKNLIEENVVILFRSHPHDKIDRWKKFVGESEFIFYDSAPHGDVKLDYSNVTMKDIMKLVSTLKYTDVHINLCSTMAVDGSIFNKPQIAPAYDCIQPRAQKGLRKMYEQEHYLPIIKSKAVHLAYSQKQLIDLVNDALKNPEKYNQNCKNCVEEIITFTDGKSSERVVDKLKEFFTR